MKRYDTLLMVDEVKMGLARPGRMLTYELEGITPDIVCLGKSLGGGLPIGATVGPAWVLDEPPASALLTMAGNPICAAGAAAVLAELTPSFLSDVAEKGAYIRETIIGWNLPVVTSVRGLGLMIGIGVSCSHRDAVGKLVESGLLALTAGADTIRLMPPLTITKVEIDAGLSILKQILSIY